MSYQIHVGSVTAVLLADGWHRVEGGTFGIEPYEYVASGDATGEKASRHGKKKAAGTPSVAAAGVTPTMGARWTKPNGEVIACPVGSVLALRHARKGES